MMSYERAEAKLTGFQLFNADGKSLAKTGAFNGDKQYEEVLEPGQWQRGDWGH